MGKLRDWWPSEELLAPRKRSCENSHKSNPDQRLQTTSPLKLSEAAAALNADVPLMRPASASLNLSEAAAALNADASLPTSTTTNTNTSNITTSCSDPSPSNTAAASPPTSTASIKALSRPAIKLANSQEHKAELLRKLLTTSSTSCSDLLQQAHKSSPSSPLQAPVKGSRPSAYKPQPASRREKIHDIHDHPINKGSLTRREIHIYSERQRRKGMTHLYTTLLSLLPDANPKTDRCTVLTEAMEYIHILQAQVEELGRQKTEILVSLGEHINLDYAFGADLDATNPSLMIEISDEIKEEVLLAADVAVRVCGRDAFITLNSPKKKGVWSGILQILHEQEMELLNVTLSTSNEMDYHCIHARMSATSDLRSHELQKMLQDLILSHAVNHS